MTDQRPEYALRDNPAFEACLASTRTAAQLEETRDFAAFMKTWPALRAVVSEGWVTQATVDATLAEIDA